MKIFAAVGTTTGALALVLAGCSSTSSDPSASETSSSEATENAAGIAYKIVKQCTNKAESIPIPATATAVQVEAIGASGWHGDGATAGTGGVVSGEFTVIKAWGDTLFAKVGCQGNGGSAFPNGGKGTNGSYGGGGSTSLDTESGGITPIIIAGGGGGSTTGGAFAGGSVDSTGKGGNGTGHGCGGQGGSATAAGKYTGGSSHGDHGGNGEKYKGGYAGNGRNYDGGGGGGGLYGGAGGCGGFTDKGSGGAGSSGIGPGNTPVVGPNYSVPSPALDNGQLSLTFLCGDDPCTSQGE